MNLLDPVLNDPKSWLHFRFRTDWPRFHAFLISAASALLALALFVLALTPGISNGNEVVASGSARALVIHGSDETLRDYCFTDSDGRTWLRLPSGASFELVTSTSDPSISNPGDGAFHPFDVAEVRAAIGAVRFPLAAIEADVYLLPYPRRGALESAAGPGLILLAPGVRPISAEVQHAQLAHELGHVVQFALMPDADDRQWSEYRRMRGIEDAGTFSATSNHANRPHEIFAEDFRALFGGEQANYSGSIENPAITPPGGITGLDRWMLTLDGASRAANLALAASPNPAHGVLSFRRPGRVSSALDVFDASGRRLASLSPSASGSITEWSWNGRDASGSRVRPGVLFARVRGDARSTTRVIVAP
jgi:hypothetical protein